MNTITTIYSNGAWIKIDHVAGTYEVSREHGVGRLLEGIAAAMLAGRSYKTLEGMLAVVLANKE
jgi:hypothetical protein